ncbi:MAG: GNAT family N-acetyltransferase [Proteobacteria bacterium]|nr:N-acetyltransferase [Pseudomonadota bacterium]NOG60533.1 GNAT family N-acetyltransferase [Pseudomonadota bacterium]
MGIISCPAALQESHQSHEFDCESNSLNEWLAKRAIKNQDSGASRTFVICSQNKVIGYYTLASGSVERLSSPKSISRNMPESIPVTVLGRLAIDKQFQQQRLGSALLKDAIQRTTLIAKDVGVRALLVHALDDQAKAFYLQYGFIESPIDSLTLFLSCKQFRPLV